VAVARTVGAGESVAACVGVGGGAKGTPGVGGGAVGTTGGGGEVEHATVSASSGRSTERVFVTELGASVAELTSDSDKCGIPVAPSNKGRSWPG
jgi:hypothetical protein